MTRSHLLHDERNAFILAAILLLSGCSSASSPALPSLGDITTPEQAERAVYVLVRTADVAMTALGDAYKAGLVDEDTRIKAERTMARFLRLASEALTAIDTWRLTTSRSDFDVKFAKAGVELQTIRGMGAVQ